MKIKTVYVVLLLGLILVFSACAKSAVVQDTEAAAPTPAPVEGAEESGTIAVAPEPAKNSQNEDTAAAPQMDEKADDSEETAATSRPLGWTDETHAKTAEPNYEVVFPDGEVKQIVITIDPANWQTMLDDMTELYGEFGTRTDRTVPPDGGQPPVPPENGAGPLPPAGKNQGNPRMPAGQAPGFGGDDDKNPVWVPATIEFEGDAWTNVGIRFKGNSSLRGAWGSGAMKLPFKLDFDEFEDDYPEIDDQRFYGFKQLSLSSGYNDSSFLREKITADIFRDAGIPAAHTAFVQVFVDYGEGPVHFGLYTMVEVVDDTVIEEQFQDDSGNLYKPEGQGASFAYGSFSEGSFDKETNQDTADWSDIHALYNALHSNLRMTEPAAWRASLESIFDVDGFLNWLAVNTVIQNWDTYGKMTHNYYLYNDPSTNLLTWIPWDNNEALHAGKQGGALSLNLAEVNAEWPLVRYLLDDEVYHAQYVAFVDETINGAFEPTSMTARYQELHDLIQPYVAAENPGYSFLRSMDAFDASLGELISHVNGRYAEASDYLTSQ